MLRTLSILLILLGLLSPGVPAQTSAPVAQTAPPKEDPAVTALALKIYAQMRTGKVDDSLLTDAMIQALTPVALAQAKVFFDQLGDPVKLTLESSEQMAGGTRWLYLAVFATAQLHVEIFLMPDGKVGGYHLAP